jgi:hypothetical protein
VGSTEIQAVAVRQPVASQVSKIARREPDFLVRVNLGGEIDDHFKRNRKLEH